MRDGNRSTPRYEPPQPATHARRLVVRERDRSALVSRMVHPNRSLVAGVGGCLRLPYLKGTSANRSSAAKGIDVGHHRRQIRLPRVLRARDPPGSRNKPTAGALQHKDFSAPLSDIRYTPRWHKAYHPTHAYCLCANWTCSTSSRFARAYAYFIFPE
jgi:hypothetical protein